MVPTAEVPLTGLHIMILEEMRATSNIRLYTLFSAAEKISAGRDVRESNEATNSIK